MTSIRTFTLLISQKSVEFSYNDDDRRTPQKHDRSELCPRFKISKSGGSLFLQPGPLRSAPHPAPTKTPAKPVCDRTSTSWRPTSARGAESIRPASIEPPN